MKLWIDDAQPAPPGYLQIVKLENCNGDAIIDPEFDCHNLRPGDLYVGKRNTGWNLGICGEIHDGYIQEQNVRIYSYNIEECRKVLKVFAK